MGTEYTPENIVHLKPNEVFVFGSNLGGQHLGGAARVARTYFGAIAGCGVGLQGQSYAIPTMHGGVEAIRPYVDEFIAFAKSHPELKFYVTRIGCGIAGFKDQQIAPLFYNAFEVQNIILPKSFWQIINHARQLASETSGLEFHAVPIKLYNNDIAALEKMSKEEKVAFIAEIKKSGNYLVEHESPETDINDFHNYMLNTSHNGFHKIAISKQAFAIIAGCKLYSNQYPWGIDLGKKIISVIAKDNSTKDYPYGQFIVLLEDGSIKELWSDTCIKPIFPGNDFCLMASGCGGLVFGLRKDGRVSVLYGENNPEVAAEVAEWVDIMQIDAGPLHVVGLRKNHTVVAAGKPSACKPLEDWQNIHKIYVPKMSPIYGKENALTFGIDRPFGWLHVDGDTWSKGHEFWKRIRGQYEVTDVIEDGYCVWVRTSDRITRAITYYSPMNYQEELEFVNRYSSFRFFDSYGNIKVLVDKDGEFRVLYKNQEVKWWNFQQYKS